MSDDVEPRPPDLRCDDLARVLEDAELDVRPLLRLSPRRVASRPLPVPRGRPGRAAARG
jgi:hypothetical protein